MRTAVIRTSAQIDSKSAVGGVATHHQTPNGQAGQQAEGGPEESMVMIEVAMPPKLVTADN